MQRSLRLCLLAGIASALLCSTVVRAEGVESVSAAADALAGNVADAGVAAAAAAPVENFAFQADVNKLMDIIINSLYSKKEVFLRELISNASDALDKIRFMSLTEEGVLGSGETAKLEMKIIADKTRKTLTIIDRGVGMTREDLIQHLGTVAQSGTSSFIEAFSEGADVNLIGQFGVGFYSVYLVADTVTVTSKSSEDDKQWIWESTADSTFSVTEDPEGATLGRGTQITLHLKEDCLEFLEEERLRGLVKHYSEFINFPIYLYTTKEEEEEVPVDALEESEEEEEEEEEDASVEDVEEEEEDAAPKTKKVKRIVNDWELVNDAKALWTRTPTDISEEEYQAFYKTLSKDHNGALTYTHFNAEGEVEFKSILFIPGEAPHDLYQDYYKKIKNIKLYVRRVMITDEFDELLPRYLSFIRGVVDSDSLPLNVSREMLQQNKVLKVIGKKMTRKVLAMIKSLADAEKRVGDTDEDEAAKETEEGDAPASKEDALKYAQFWKSFGKYIKMGLMEDSSNRTRLAKLLRYATSKSESEISLEDYVSGMKEDQKNIYYISGESRESLLKSPAVEKLLLKEIEVIFMTDPLDEYTVQHLTEFEGKRLINAAREGLKLDEQPSEKRLHDMYKEKFAPLTSFIKQALGGKVDKVTVSKHLVKSPVVVTTADYGWTAQMEKVMKAQAFADNSRHEFMKAKRNFEFNPRHPLIVELNKKVQAEPEDKGAADMLTSLYMASVLQAGYQLTPEEVSDFAERVTAVVTSGLGLDADAELLPELEVPEAEAAEDDEEEEIEEVPMDESTPAEEASESETAAVEMPEDEPAAEPAQKDEV
ncbi:Hsp90 protein-domain-containing protein [Pavlovales sp. CCMP2436]|nr:Hsp90 protein-domain-containing protein [Pavlovales sp. CCMP2436]|mmetsp:Transcript_37381/g.92613  ORF Transcript_37381/g.92613 Transcript_37381/m.92613 type:complete len:823 (-) Transcript_37381:349-2817(-)